MGQLLLSLPSSFTAHIKHTKTKCPFQHQPGGGGIQPSPPKGQTKVCPCGHGQNAILHTTDGHCCHVLCSFAIIAKRQGAFVNHKEENFKVSGPWSGVGNVSKCL